MKKSILVPVDQIEFLGLEFCRNETICSSIKGSEDCSDVSKCNRRQLEFKGFDKVTEEINFHNSSNFPSNTSDSFPATDTNTGLEKKYDVQICNYSGSAGQRRAVMVDNQHKNLQ